jgi:D-alanyl-D-alanine carboxypeptidase
MAARLARRRRTLVPVGLVALVSLALCAGWLLLSDGSQPTGRLESQRLVDRAVAEQLAPGAVAYVSSPRATWLGVAGEAHLARHEPMRPDARMRLESISKIYTATLILRLAEQGRLRLGDTVERRLPGLLPYGEKITIRQLLTMRSGLFDRSDVERDGERYVARIKDRRLVARLRAVSRRTDANPATEVDPMWWIRMAAWQPLLFAPGTDYHYSNVGYELLGLIAERAGGKPLAELYRQHIFEPLGLRQTAYDAQGPIAGPHASGYLLQPDGTTADATEWHWGVGADAGIVSDARETAAFLTALMRGKLLGRQSLEGMRGEDLWAGGKRSGCGRVYGWSGAAVGYKTDAWASADGTRVVVLLLNARRADPNHQGDARATDSAMALYCSAAR